MTTTRTRTPSEIKWLANELAATKGELERIDDELARLRARRKRLKAVLHPSLWCAWCEVHLSEARPRKRETSNELAIARTPRATWQPNLKRD